MWESSLEKEMTTGCKLKDTWRGNIYKSGQELCSRHWALTDVLCLPDSIRHAPQAGEQEEHTAIWEDSGHHSKRATMQEKWVAARGSKGGNQDREWLRALRASNRRALFTLLFPAHTT